MKAFVLRTCAPAASRPLRLEEVPVRVPGSREILVRVSACAVCRTDLHIVEGDLPPMRSAMTPGHQAVGTVEKAGPGCTLFKPGDRAGIAWLRHTCQSCGYCSAGRENLCDHASFTGYNADGGFAEYALIEEDYAYHLSQERPPEEQAPLLCAGIIGYHALKKCALPRGGRLAMFGFGSSAHLTVQAALAGDIEVFAVTRSENHQTLARELGAVWAGSDASKIPSLVDSSVVFAPAGSAVLPALECLKKGGTAVIAGIHLTDIPPLDYDRHIFHEKTLVSVEANTRVDGSEFLELAESIPIVPRVVKYPFETANQALIDLKEGRISGAPVLMTGQE